MAYIFQRPFLRGLSTEGNLPFKIDRASLIFGSKFTVSALFYFVFEGNFFKFKPPWGLYLEGRFNRGFFGVNGLGGLYLEGLIYGGAYFRILRYFTQEGVAQISSVKIWKQMFLNIMCWVKSEMFGLTFIKKRLKIMDWMAPEKAISAILVLYYHSNVEGQSRLVTLKATWERSHVVWSNSHATGVSNKRSGGPTSFLLRFFAYPPNFAFRPEKKERTPVGRLWCDEGNTGHGQD